MWYLPFGTRVDRALRTGTRVARRERRRSGTGFRLGVESLEGRALLATLTVNVVNDAFNPGAVTVHVGDTVHWVWVGSDHSTTSVKGSAEAWDSGIHNAGFSFDHTFTQTGTFAYYCMVHGFDNGNGTASGMSGTIKVTATTPAAAPTLTGEQRVFTGKGPRRKIVGFELLFSTALDTGEAQNVGHYQVTQPGRTKRSSPVVVPVTAARYDPGNNSVMLTLGKFNAKKPLTLTATGLIGATGTPASPIVTKL